MNTTGEIDPKYAFKTFTGTGIEGYDPMLYASCKFIVKGKKYGYFDEIKFPKPGDEELLLQKVIQAGLNFIRELEEK